MYGGCFTWTPDGSAVVVLRDGRRAAAPTRAGRAGGAVGPRRRRSADRRTSGRSRRFVRRRRRRHRRGVAGIRSGGTVTTAGRRWPRLLRRPDGRPDRPVRQLPGVERSRHALGRGGAGDSGGERHGRVEQRAVATVRRRRPAAPVRSRRHGGPRSRRCRLAAGVAGSPAAPRRRRRRPSTPMRRGGRDKRRSPSRRTAATLPSPATSAGSVGCRWSTSTPAPAATSLVGSTASCRGAATGSPRFAPGPARRRRSPSMTRTRGNVGPWPLVRRRAGTMCRSSSPRRSRWTTTGRRCTPAGTEPGTDRSPAGDAARRADRAMARHVHAARRHVAAAGWDVLLPDHRGSTGHGRAYQQALDGRWGELDVSDTAA